MHEPRSTRGFSLIELIVGLALLGWVLISISGLFALGVRQLESGRSLSIALSSAREIQEEMQGWAFARLYEQFGVSPGASAGRVDTRTPGYAAKWQPRLDASLRRSHAEIGLEALDGGGGVATLESAAAVRVVVTVYWREGSRARDVRLVTVRS